MCNVCLQRKSRTVERVTMFGLDRRGDHDGVVVVEVDAFLGDVVGYSGDVGGFQIDALYPCNFS